MTKSQLKQQRLEVPTQSPNRRTKKKQKGGDNDTKMDEDEEETNETTQKVSFTNKGEEVFSLFKKPNDDRWKKLPAPVKEVAKAYPLSSRFVPASESLDGVSCHDDFAATARLYIVCHQIETTTPTQAANSITVAQWKTFFEQVLAGPATLIGKTKLQKGDQKRRAATQFLTNLSYSDPKDLFGDSIQEGKTVLPDNNIGRTWMAAISVLGCYYPKPTSPTPELVGPPAKDANKKKTSFQLPTTRQHM